MAASLASLRLATNILSLVQVSVKIVARLEEFNFRSSDLPETFQNLAIQLPLLKVTLERIHQQIAKGKVEHEVVLALDPVIDDTNHQMKLLDEKLSALVLPKTANALKIGITDVRSLFSEDQITRASMKVLSCINFLVLHEPTNNYDISAVILGKISQLSLLDDTPASVENRVQLLHQACRQGLRKSIHMIIGLHTPVDCKDTMGRTPLHPAASSGQKEVVISLCDLFKAKIDVLDFDGQTPLFVAVEAVEFEIAYQLYQRGASLSIRDEKHHKTPLDLVSNDFLALWQIRHGVSQNAKDPVTGNTALIESLLARNHVAADKLIGERVDVNAVNSLRWTALSVACSLGQTTVIGKLLQRGADPNMIDDSNWSPFTRCIWSGQYDAMVLLLKDKRTQIDTKSTCAGRTPLLEAVYSWHWDIVELLLTHGADPNFAPRESPLRKTILHCADEIKLVRLIKLFVKHGANVNAIDSDGWSPLTEAVNNRRLDAARCLIEHGASVDGYIDGCPYICYLSSKSDNDVAMIRLLLQSGADVNAANQNGCTAIRKCVHYGHVETLRCLLEHGANAKGRLGNGQLLDGHKNVTLLMHAVHSAQMHERTNYRAIIPALIAHGADVEDIDSHGWTALRAAVDKNYEDVACILLNHGANPTSKAHDGITVMSVAKDLNMRYFCSCTAYMGDL